MKCDLTCFQPVAGRHDISAPGNISSRRQRTCQSTNPNKLQQLGATYRANVSRMNLLCADFARCLPVLTVIRHPRRIRKLLAKFPGRLNEVKDVRLPSFKRNLVEAAGVEPASLANKPAATTCLVRKRFSAMRWRPDSNRTA